MSDETQNLAFADTSPESQTSAKKKRKKRTTKAKPPLLFVDTNIFLDFYRARNDAGINLLSRIDSLHDLIITTCQVEMEFKKNRQKVISESVALLKPPEFSLSTPAFLLEAKTVAVIKSKMEDVRKRVENLKGRILSTLENPKTQDRIYQTMQRLFSNGGSLNLRHETPEYKSVWRRALRRFLEGRPPRKKEDTSAGDSINWEWIVRCVESNNRDVIIVSRDADYGLTLNNKGYANNWLAEELKERVNQQRKIILVDRLSTALKLLDVKVTAAEITSERAIIQSSKEDQQDEIEAIIDASIHDLLDTDEISSLIANSNATGWGIDTSDLQNVRAKDGKWFADLHFTISGEQDDEKVWYGSSISGSCVAVVDADKTVTFTAIEAEMDDGDDEPEPGEPDELKP
jgi:hypothetical protein